MGQMDDTEPGSALRVHEMRIAVEFTTGDVPAGLAGVLDDAPKGWQVESLDAGDERTWLISGFVGECVGTPEYARRAHSLVQRILGTGLVDRAEADLPVSAFVDLRSADPGTPEFPPGSDVPRWARDAIRCDEAWAIEPTRGHGILIGHPDTGYTLHPNLGADALDLNSDWDVISDDDDALDPMVPPDDSPWPLPFPGHGTTTASVIAGRGDEADGIVGVVPRAKVVPFRAVESVVQLFDSDVARAVERARLTGCHLVSISVGGKGFFGLEAAIQRAVDAGMIVIAAAGNNVGIVVAPASYPNCLAVAATGPDDQPWPESSRGRAVDVGAPGWGVHVAGYVFVDSQPQARVFRSSGTSYAATHLAGAAALWLAHHDADSLRARYGSRVQEVFLRLVRAGGSRVPDGWDHAAFGAGIVDAAALLAAPLPALDQLMPLSAGPVAQSPSERLGALVNRDAAEIETALAGWLGIGGTALQGIAKRFEGELAFHLTDTPEFRNALVDGCPTAPDLAGIGSCSPEFASIFLRDCQGT